jgi:hypothetical protein
VVHVFRIAGRYKLFEFLLKPARYSTGFARANGFAVDAQDGGNFGRSSSEESFVAGIQFSPRDQAFRERNFSIVD